MGLNLGFLFNLLKKILIIVNIIAFSYMLSLIINSYLALKNFQLLENIEIKKEKKEKKEISLNFINSIFIKNTTNPVITKERSSSEGEKVVYNLKDIKLIGTLIFNKERIALLKYNGNTSLVKKGQIINGYKVTKIDKTVVYLEKNGKIYKITTDLSSRKTSISKSAKTQNITSPAAESEQVIKLSRGLVEKETADIGNLLKDVRLIPVVKNGETIGFKFTYINPRSLLYKYGLRSGDLVKSINGMPVRTAEEAFKIYNMLRNENRIKLEVERNGKRKVIIYEIQ